ncbi:MAG TPA: GntG family PLP-dependent aldolase [Melioribacteraceae bacterium]|nr:GntG family PLP-dependent aldolase [Melioribacteraceae bacterium]
MKIIDLRSDTVTLPSEGMRRAMYEAEVGDDVYREDPTVIKLERMVAEMFGKEAALFVPSGTMSNQLALNVLTNPGDEVICESDAHIFHYESGSPAKLSGIQLYPVKGKNGLMFPEDVEECIRHVDAYYMPRTKVVAIENTHNRAGGTIIPLGNIKELKELTNKYGLYFHCDGARIWNAATETKISYAEYGKYFDTISVCLSKGLGAPVGSLLLGTKDLITKAFRVRKSYGGGMRQIGILAAAGIYALKYHLSALSEDHKKAKLLANYLANNDIFEIDYDNVQTNMVMFKVNEFDTKEFIEECSKLGLLLSEGKPKIIRAVTHRDISFEEVEFSTRIITRVIEEGNKYNTRKPIWR